MQLVAETLADGDTEVTVLLPRIEHYRFWHRLLHDRTADAIADALADFPTPTSRSCRTTSGFAPPPHHSSTGGAGRNTAAPGGVVVGRSATVTASPSPVA